MNCPKCKKARVRQHVSVYVECDAECKNLSKKGIRSTDVKVIGAGWPQAMLFCPRCGWALRLKENDNARIGE